MQKISHPNKAQLTDAPSIYKIIEDKLWAPPERMLWRSSGGQIRWLSSSGCSWDRSRSSRSRGGRWGNYQLNGRVYCRKCLGRLSERIEQINKWLKCFKRGINCYRKNWMIWINLFSVWIERIEHSIIYKRTMSWDQTIIRAILIMVIMKNRDSLYSDRNAGPFILQEDTWADRLLHQLHLEIDCRELLKPKIASKPRKTTMITKYPGSTSSKKATGSWCNQAYN